MDAMYVSLSYRTRKHKIMRGRRELVSHPFESPDRALAMEIIREHQRRAVKERTALRVGELRGAASHGAFRPTMEEEFARVRSKSRGSRGPRGKMTEEAKKIMLAKRAATIAAKKHGAMPSGGAGHADSSSYGLTCSLDGVCTLPFDHHHHVEPARSRSRGPEVDAAGRVDRRRGPMSEEAKARRKATADRNKAARAAGEPSPRVRVAFMRSHSEEHGGYDPDCPKLTGKKYTDRPGPPRAGNATGCRGKQKTGNDGYLYESVPNKRGVYSWRKVKDV